VKRLARALTRLYPASWRQRYGEEFEALLEQCQASPRMVVNTLGGAVGAWLRWPTAAAGSSARLRGALTAVLWGGLVVLAAASGFVKAEIPATHRSVHAVGTAMVAVSLVAAVIMAAGAVLPAMTVTRLAVAQHRTDVLRLIAAPPAAGLLFFGLVAVLAGTVRLVHPAPALGHTLFYVIGGLFVVAAIITGRAPTLALRRLDPGARVLRASVPFGVLTVAALAAVTGLMAAYTIMLDRYEPWLAHSIFGPPLQHDTLLVQLILTTAAMALGTLLAATGLVQGTLRRPAAAGAGSSS
jgi:hypothetical protein